MGLTLGHHDKFTLDKILRSPSPTQRLTRGGAAPGQQVRDLGETGPVSQGVQVGRKAPRIRHINSMEVRKKRPRCYK